MSRAWIRWGMPLMFVVAAGCGGKSSSVTGPAANSGPNPTPTGNLTAKVDGAAWSGNVSALGAILGAPGLYSISAVNTTDFTTIILSLYNIGATGTYPLGVNLNVFGGTGLYTNATGGWNTPLSGAAGSVTITTLTAGRIAGTFSFTATPVSGSAAGTRTITEGQFDLAVTVQGSGGPPAANAGSRLSADLDGRYFNGATIASSYTMSGTHTLVISALTTRGVLSMSIAGVAGTGDYSIGSMMPLVRLSFSSASGDTLWGGSTTNGPGGLVSSDSGTITITSITSERIAGTFSGLLAPGPVNPAPGTMAVANGAFDVGLP